MTFRPATLIASASVALVLAASVSAAGPPPNDSGPLPTIGGVSSESRIEPRYSRAASALVGRTVEVRCWSSVDWSRLDSEWRAATNGAFGITAAGGYRNPTDDTRLHLSPNVCGRLFRLAYGKTWPTTLAGRYAIASAVTIVAHESQHLRGVVPEDEAECYGQQTVRRAARLLGATKARAETLAVVAWRHGYARLPLSYRSPECRNGGTLDLNPSSSVWP